MKPLLLILFGYLFVKAVENILALVNLWHIENYGSRIPSGFDGFVDQETLTQMRDYSVDNSRFGFLSSGVDVAVTLVFLFGGLLNSYNSWLVSQEWSFIVTGIAFFLLLTYAQFLLHIPFGLYSTFHIENKYGFNKQTWRLWLVDTVKGLVLTTVLSAVVLGAVFWLIKSSPEYWWLVVWLFLLIFKLFMLYISPYVIEPLFNKFVPIADKGLEEKIKQLFVRAGLSISRVFTMDASRRSGHGNAYFSGIGHVKRIVLFDTLLEKSSDDEILAILAHEAGHWKKKHILKRLVMMECFSFVGIYVAWTLVQGDWLAQIFGIADPTLYVKLLLVGFCSMLVLFPLKPVFAWFSRKDEWEADRYAVDLTGTPHTLARALVKLGRDNLANLHPHPWYTAFYYSHPPLSQRVSRLLKASR
ncbi:MAG: M48 family metallopeptidase [Desulfobulbaceae bacterium]|uniref:M48 family metallopeptidase n=1 Tax=Candidatus Desulfobia pelagia TaxID=2841692 RepID=A0A8J6NBX4_9BACT|nr:M48 family metallopeptidase [Candidatus Desulfobia pelagia]